MSLKHKTTNKSEFVKKPYKSKRDHLTHEHQNILKALEKYILSLDKTKSDSFQSKYDSINNVLKQHIANNGYCYEMNILLSKKGYDNIDLLRNFVKSKNKRDYREVSMSEWTTYYKNIYTCLQNIGIKDVPITSIQKCVFELWKTYTYNWAGFWTVIASKGKLHQCIDPDDWSFIVQYFKTSN